MIYHGNKDVLIDNICRYILRSIPFYEPLAKKIKYKQFYDGISSYYVNMYILNNEYHNLLCALYTKHSGNKMRCSSLCVEMRTKTPSGTRTKFGLIVNSMDKTSVYPMVRYNDQITMLIVSGEIDGFFEENIERISNQLILLGYTTNSSLQDLMDVH